MSGVFASSLLYIEDALLCVQFIFEEGGEEEGRKVELHHPQEGGEAKYQGCLVFSPHLCSILRMHCSVFNSFFKREGRGEEGGVASSSRGVRPNTRGVWCFCFIFALY